jgi:rSAM/selenodomain-associated transferase 1
MDNSFLCNVQFRVQNGIDLGSRMKNAFDQVLCEGYEKAVVIGTDCPGITTAIINEAFKKLNLTEVVFGPAEDGGYYLLGLKKIDFNLFNKMTWSNQHVLSESIRRLNLDHISFKLLEMLSDIDNESDWEKCKNLISKPL